MCIIRRGRLPESIVSTVVELVTLKSRAILVYMNAAQGRSLLTVDGHRGKVHGYD